MTLRYCAQRVGLLLGVFLLCPIFSHIGIPVVAVILLPAAVSERHTRSAEAVAIIIIQIIAFQLVIPFTMSFP